MEASADPDKRCRLCLHEDIDGSFGLQNIDGHEDENLSFKIRECLGVSVSTDDIVRNICYNCLQTVFFIDEFRKLCHQTEGIYHSNQVLCEDSEKCKQYGEFVTVLRQLVQDHKHAINKQLIRDISCNDYEPEAGGTIGSEFVPLSEIKYEPEENIVDYDADSIDIKEIGIRIDSPTNGESDENNDGEQSSEIDPMSYTQQVKLAEAVLERLHNITSNVVNQRKIWTEIADHMGMEYSIIETRWNAMKEHYLLTKAKAATASKWTILRLNKCSLFNLMNKIVPELDPNVETWIAPSVVADTGKHPDGASCSVGFQIALAKEMKNYPELWDTSVACSTHSIDQAWKRIAAHFRIKNSTIRSRWRTIQDLYRKHSSREEKELRENSHADGRINELMEILDQINQTNAKKEITQQKHNSKQLIGEDDDNEKNNIEAQKPPEKTFKKMTSYQLKISLAKLVYPHEFLWNHKHVEYRNHTKREAMWQRISTALGITRDGTRAAWRSLQSLYRGRVKRQKKGLLRPDDEILQEPFFEQIEQMFSENMRMGSVPVGTLKKKLPNSTKTTENREEAETVNLQTDQNMALVLLCQKYALLWDTQHPNYRNRTKRDSIWHFIGEKLNLTMGETKAIWVRLRSFYRRQTLRYLKGDLTADSDIIRGPLYQKLNEILKNNTNLDKKKERDKIFLNVESKHKLIDEVFKHEHLWNTAHPDFLNVVLRERKWKKIAKDVNQPSERVKYAYKLVRDAFRNRIKRMKLYHMDVVSYCKKDPFHQKMEIIISKSERCFRSKRLHAAEKFDPTMEDESDTMSQGKVEDVSFEHDSEINLKLSQLCSNHEMIWNSKHPDFSNFDKTDAAWNSIAQEMTMPKSDVKKRWAKLRAIYRVRKHKISQQRLTRRNKQLYDPLYQILNTMLENQIDSEESEENLGTPDPPEQKIRLDCGDRNAGPVANAEDKSTLAEKVLQLSDEESVASALVDDSKMTNRSENQENEAAVDHDRDFNMILVQLCSTHEMIWNSKHPDFLHNYKREEVWDSIAREMSLTKSEVKNMWTNLKDQYRSRRQGKTTEQGSQLSDALYHKLNSMLEQSLDVGSAKASEQASPNDNGDSFINAETRSILIEKVWNYEYLWNAAHHDFNNNAKRDDTWNRIADEMKQNIERIKHAYKLVCDNYRYRIRRMLLSHADIASHCEKDPLFKKMEMILSSGLRTSRSKQFPIDAHTSNGAEKSVKQDLLKDPKQGIPAQRDSEFTLKIAQLFSNNEMIWNKKHVEHLNFEKRDEVMESIAREMNLTNAKVKKMWTRLRNIYRSRRVRQLQGKISETENRCDPLYQTLHSMLEKNMRLGGNGGEIFENTSKSAKPFSTVEDKVRLIEEVFKNESLWNPSHVDYLRAEKRGVIWTQIANKFDNCNAWAARGEWRRLRNINRSKMSSTSTTPKPVGDGFNKGGEQTNSGPLYKLFSKMAENTEEGIEGNRTVQEETAMSTEEARKRLIEEFAETYLRKKQDKRFDKEGCIKVLKAGTIRYEKVCEICGKQMGYKYFEYHMNQHKGLKPYVCSYEGCTRKYSTKLTRDLHELQIHSGNGKTYECDKCDGKFKYRTSFDYHLKTQHKIQSLPCTICGKIMKHKIFLEEHMQRHSIRNYPYTVDGNKLDRRRTLDNHMRREHPKENP